MKISKEQAKKARSVADEFARTSGHESIEDIINPIQANLNGSEVQREMGRVAARSVVENLTKLILRMELFTTPNPDYMDRVLGYFDDGVVKEGNAKIYRFNNPTGNSTYSNTDFVPNALTTTDVDEFTIGMYSTGTGSALTLSTQGYQFRKTLVFTEPQWIPYFKSGKLIEFIAELQENMYKTWKMFMFNKLMTLITTNGNIDKTITGTKQNAFEAWSQEILPEIRKMTTLSSSYNANGTNTNLMLTNPNDLLIFANPKTIQTLESGIKTQLFQAKFLDLKGILDENNFIDAGLKLTINNENTKISVQGDYYIAEDKIYVVSKQAIKHFSQIDRIETAFYGRNLATEFTMHKWGAIDFLPWGQAFVYTNSHLNDLP